MIHIHIFICWPCSFYGIAYINAVFRIQICRIRTVCFWASRIRIRIRNLFVRIRILPSANKKIKKNLDFYVFVTSSWHVIFEECCQCTGTVLSKKKVTDKTSRIRVRIRIRIRIRAKMSRIPNTALMIGVVAGVQEIHSGVVASTFPITMEELIEFRRDYVGTPEDAIREIIYRYVRAGPRAPIHGGGRF